jgi:anaerobic magnesium-protoporphyrin IX monomethyl ester cyclase
MHLGTQGGLRIAVGPHGSVTPQAVFQKLPIDGLIRGECEEAVCEIASAGRIQGVTGAAWRDGDKIIINGSPRVSAFVDLPALHWPQEWIAHHRHHHHRFNGALAGFGAEVEASRGCPYACSFCAKIDFRDRYRRRNLPNLLGEIDGLIAQGVSYLYFIDEIFLPDKALLGALCERKISFGVQTRVDL